MIDGPFSSPKNNTLAVIAVVVLGAVLLFFVMRMAFSVTSGLLGPTPPL